MRIVLAGGSGFLGDALRTALGRDGHRVSNLTRRRPPLGSDDVNWTPDGSAGPWAAALSSADAVINLAGEGIADRRWTAERKTAILQSRLLPTRSLVAAIDAAPAPPRVFISASGIGYYGSRGDEIVTEATPPGGDFLAGVCVKWEAEAEQASSVTRVAIVRTGLVLHHAGGALARMLLPFRLGAGGPIGSGRQYMPWIHLDDWVSLVRWLIDTGAARGAFNLSAPNPVRNRDFARALGRALHRPSMLPMPGIAMRLALGEMADLLLTGQRAIPARATELGFRFRYERLDAAFAELFQAGKR